MTMLDNEGFARSKKLKGYCGLLVIANVTGLPLEKIFEDYKRKFKKRCALERYHT